MEDKTVLEFMNIIVEKSKATTWDLAKREWRVRRVTFNWPISKCLCGKDRMTCVCELFNETRRTLLEVDACCVTFVVGEYW
jgi:hypothetical protein